MKPAARLTDKHVCPIHGPNAIVSVSTASTCDGLPVARVGDMTACGATILVGSPVAIVDNKPVAHIGSPTSHGGTIVTGSPKMLV
ncbi:PAAR domain-containing protein [Tateyamaria sp. SN6-1]|uniref:PAAR domain-containing protein n=1 Tax=Tateyamaria sp. SN6-1 TaxID=3092148 RepID=UPI0039F44A58